MRWIKRLGLALAGVMLTITASIYAMAVYVDVIDTKVEDLGVVVMNRLDRLVTCVQYDRLGIRVACRYFLTSGEFTQREMEWMNQHGHFGMLFSLKDVDLAKVALARLVEQGLDVNAVQAHVARANELGWTALHVAAFGPAEVWEIQALLENGARADIKDINGQTPLNLAESALARRPGDDVARQAVELMRNHAQANEVTTQPPPLRQ